MALQQSIDFKNGVVSENAYLEVTSINLDFERKSANFTLKTYLNKESKEQGLNTIIQPENIYVSDDITLPSDRIVESPSNKDNFTKYFSTGDSLANAYSYIKTLPNHLGAIEIK